MSPAVDLQARLALLLGGVVVCIGAAGLVQSGIIGGIDTAVLDAVASVHGSPLDALMVVISELGVSNVLSFFSAFAIAFLLWTGAQRGAAFVALAYVLSWILTGAIKTATARPRPPAAYVVELEMPDVQGAVWAVVAAAVVMVLWRTRWRWPAILGATLYLIAAWYDPALISTRGIDSFPSGHALRSLVLVSSILYVVPHPPRPRILVTLGLVLFAIGLSRVYLGQHHPSDVIAGWAAGIALVAGLSLLPLVRGAGIARPSLPAESGAG